MCLRRGMGCCCCLAAALSFSFVCVFVLCVLDSGTLLRVAETAWPLVGEEARVCSELFTRVFRALP